MLHGLRTTPKEGLAHSAVEIVIWSAPRCAWRILPQHQFERHSVRGPSPGSPAIRSQQAYPSLSSPILHPARTGYKGPFRILQLSPGFTSYSLMDGLTGSPRNALNQHTSMPRTMTPLTRDPADATITSLGTCASSLGIILPHRVVRHL